MASDNRLAHLEMIQGVINRLSTNSFLLKGWSVILLSAILALASSSDGTTEVLAIGYLPIVTLWLLDAYFLRQERLFRALYDRVRLTEPDAIDFDMNTAMHASDVGRLDRVARSPTLAAFHGGLIATVTVLMFAWQ